MPEGTVASVHVRGLRTVSEALVREAIGSREGTELDLEWVREDIEAMLALEAFENVYASAVAEETGYVELTYEVVERPLLSGVVVRGSLLPSRNFERPRAGELFEAAAAHRAAQRLAVHHRTLGYDQAVAFAHAQRDGERVELCLEVQPGRRRRIASFELVGNERVSDAELRELMETHGERLNVVGEVYREGSLADDVQRWTVLYYDRGFLNVRVHDPETEWEGDDFRVVIRIEEGPVFRLGRLEITGDLLADASRYTALLRQASGDVFNRSLLLESIEAIYALEEELGRARDAVDILPTTELLPEEALVHITLELRALETPTDAPQTDEPQTDEPQTDEPQTEESE